MKIIANPNNANLSNLAFMPLAPAEAGAGGDLNYDREVLKPPFQWLAILRLIVLFQLFVYRNKFRARTLR